MTPCRGIRGASTGNGKHDAIDDGEIAKARGGSKPSAISLAFPRRGARQAGKWRARVVVPLAELDSNQPRTQDSNGNVIRTLENTIALLLEQLHREQRLADQARADFRAE